MKFTRLAKVNADDVDDAGQHDVGDDPDPARHVRQRRGEIGRADQPDHHGQEEIVEQDRPADQETRMDVDRSPRIAVGGAGNRMDRRHAAIAVGRQQDGGERDQIGAGRRALRLHRQHAERAEHDHRRHIGQAEQHDRAQSQAAVELYSLAGHAISAFTPSATSIRARRSRWPVRPGLRRPCAPCHRLSGRRAGYGPGRHRPGCRSP